MNGGLGGNRTHDQWIKSPVLYRLSYQPDTDRHQRRALLEGAHHTRTITQIHGVYAAIFISNF